MPWTDIEHEELPEVVQTQADLIAVMRELSAELDLEVIMQRVVDEARRFTNATHAAFFHRGDESDDKFALYTFSGADQSKIQNLAPVRHTPLFEPTFTHGQLIRVSDVTADPRYGMNTPHRGVPTGHFPVVSYMAVPVMGRAGGVFGALLFSHPEANQFLSRHEYIAQSIAAQAAVALENAFLFRRAQEAIRTRDDFLSVAAHEIRTPLTPLALQLQFLKSKLPTVRLGEHNKAIANKSLDIACKQTARLTLLVDELLDVSRIRVNRLQMDFEELDLVEMTRDILDRYAVQAKHAGIQLTLDAHKEPIVGQFDRLRMQQVIINVLTNAIKYAPGAPVHVVVKPDSNQASISVADHGPGIAKEDQQRIFGRFERANENLKRGGLGLGLYIGQEIVEAHSGTITVESQPGSGATFTVTLPLTRGSNA